VSIVAPTIFVGPSMPLATIRSGLGNATILPPIRRGDLYRAREAGGDVFLILDGVFTHHLAVSPREVIDVACDGATVVGASSMGALRAAECWPVGVRGVGAIYRLFRRGWLDSDDEVAVITDPDREYRAMSVALVNVRAAMSRARRRGLVSPSMAENVIAAAAAVFYSDRQWPDLLRRAGVQHHDELLVFVRECDLKREDARLALDLLPALRLPAAAKLGPPGRFERPDRAPGVDWTLGLTETERADQLVRWLLGTGRYLRHIWALVAGEPELANGGPARRDPEAMRGRLAACLRRMLDRPRELARALEEELAFEDELDAELIRMYAVRQTARLARASGVVCRPSLEQLVRDEVAAVHGAFAWAELKGAAANDRLWGVIPLEWIEDVAGDIALARAARELAQARRAGPQRR
jgi:hypothetical protein